MRKFVLIFVFALVAFSSLTYAYPDPAPLIVAFAEKNVVDTWVGIHIEAQDHGFYSGLVSVVLKEDGNIVATQSCSYSTICYLDYTAQHANAGTHNYLVIAKDRGDNVATASFSVRFIGATPPPVMSFDKKYYVYESQYLEIPVNAYDFYNKPINVTLVSGLPIGASFQNNFLRWTPDYTQSGTYSLTFTAADIKGQRVTKSVSIVVLNINRPPVVSAVSPQTGDIAFNADSGFIFSINMSDPDNDSPRLEWLVDGSEKSSSSTFSYAPGFGGWGNHIVIARITDGDYIRRYAWNVTINYVNRKPAMSQIGKKSVKIGKEVKFSVSATDPDHNYLTYAATQLPFGAKFDPDIHVFDWTPQQPGTFDVSFRVTDTYGLSSGAATTITVIDKTDLEKYTDLYKQMLQEAQQEQQTTDSQIQLSPSPITTQPVCNPDYLCYTVEYFLR